MHSSRPWQLPIEGVPCAAAGVLYILTQKGPPGPWRGPRCGPPTRNKKTRGAPTLQLHGHTICGGGDASVPLPFSRD
eukprot:7800694-Pyramimonas_sp.AAC.1